MKKRFLSIMLVLVLSLFFVGCGNYADMYSLNKDVKIEENTETVELENIKNDLIESMKDVKVISAEISFKMDTGEIQIIGKKQRIVVDLSMELVMDSTDEVNPKMSVIAKGYSENYENGAKMETMEAEASQYLKEGYLYNYNYEKDTKMVDGKAETETKEEKTKTKFEGELGDTPGVPGEMPEIPTDMQEIVDMINSIIEEFKKLPNAEIGKDGKGNFVLQDVQTDLDGHRKCLQRVVFADGLLVFAGINLGQELGLGDGLLEVGINCNKGKVKYPNFDDYKEVTLN